MLQINGTFGTMTAIQKVGEIIKYTQLIKAESPDLLKAKEGSSPYSAEALGQIHF